MENQREDINTSPQILNIYLEANHVQSREKGLRIIIRNTDTNPDIFFVDIYFSNQWYIEGYGIINSEISLNPSSSPFICTRKVAKTIDNELGKQHELIPSHIIAKHFNGKYDCKE